MQLAAPRSAQRGGARRMTCSALARPHQALLGAGGDLPDRRARLAGQLQGQQHLPLLRQPARRAAAGLDHRPDRHRHDRGDPHRRHRPLGRLDHGALLGGLRHAARPCRAGPRPPPWACRRSRSTALVVVAWRVAASCFTNAAKRAAARRGARAETQLDAAARRWSSRLAVGVVAARRWRSGSCCRRSPTKFGVLGVLLVAPCVGLLFGAINGVIIVGGRLQPFIVTLAMMVTALGIARLTAGQNNAVLPVYTGSNAVAEFDVLRCWSSASSRCPGLFFLAAIAHLRRGAALHAFGRYVYAIGGNEEAARLSGIDVGARQDRHLCPLRHARRRRRACSTWRSTARASPTPAPASSSTPSPRWSSAAPA